MLKEILEVCKGMSNPRTSYEVLGKMMEEVGETAQEVLISNGFLKKPVGKDGVIGECVDVIITAVDLINKEDPFVSYEDIAVIANNKLQKWQGMYTDPLRYHPEATREKERAQLIANAEQFIKDLKNGAPVGFTS